VADARISPDGRWVAYVERWNDRVADAVRANLWVAASDGTSRRRVSEGAWVDSAPRWSADGAQLAWISERGGASRVYAAAREGGAARLVSALDAAALDLAWSPDGNWIAFAARPAAAPPAWAGAAFERFLRLPPAAAQVYVAPALGGEARRISPGNADYSGEPAWTADGLRVLAAPDGREIVALSAAGGEERVLATGASEYARPRVSPDGSKIAYLARDAKPQSYVVRKLYVMASDGGRARALSGALDRDAAEPQWSSDSRTVYFLADDHGATRIYAARNDGALRQVTNAPERLRGFSLAENGRAAAVVSSAAAPHALVAFSIFEPAERATLAAPNAEWLARREFGTVERVEYESGSGRIEGWLVKPAGFNAARQYPLLIEALEEPRAMCGYAFSLRAQAAAARGFLALCVNPRGAPGYGEQFGALLPTRDPGDDFEDVMQGVDFASALPYVDSRRVYLAGGTLAAWALGHTGRFAAIVARRPRVFVGSPEDAALFVARSPLFHAAAFRTPTLVIAGDAQSDALYQALQQRRVESALLRLPAERPGSLALEWEAELNWMAAHVLVGQTSKSAAGLQTGHSNFP
jgi:dipeptidyl aminopeptidase/acylaminoacyl peptidase